MCKFYQTYQSLGGSSQKDVDAQGNRPRPRRLFSCLSEPTNGSFFCRSSWSSRELPWLLARFLWLYAEKNSRKKSDFPAVSIIYPLSSLFLPATKTTFLATAQG
ncbi:hypothetical protein TWF102_011759 [Orbilia oligospora]|uniref:Uncharacterized protein n=1 Tax=Orbilia oligospora TaxID=2813651 RepID=A0A7C8J2V5_ORBOL|nr:hypothetical protein TWF102_011759 [Orbilia oligospora]KAF3104565.1 hypothetical protein TWF103_006888 [Orbilia oligospora]KAF3116419.1 hypothetical protein TWF706_004058 [Orbilia oligospora]KAF3128777.1 hypothetical protein TWF594_011449 [Orbilia oligospora]